MKRNLIVALVIFLALGFSSVSFGGEGLFVENGVKTGEGQKYVPGEIIVQFNPGVSEDMVRKINRGNGTSVLSVSKRGKFKRLRVPRNKTVEEMVAIYSKNPNVDYAEPNYMAKALMVPNDEYYPYQWHMDNPVYGGINMECAWGISTGTEVIVAVIDTGVAYEDYDKYYQAPDLAATSFVDGWDYVNNDNHPNDDNSHGTHVAGTIAQSTNNDLGVAGVAFNASIMPVKVLNKRGSGTYAAIADGIYFAADNGAAVINMSLGGEFDADTLEDAVAYAYNAGVTIVCAAGNDYNTGNNPGYPAAYDAYCIAVGATTYDETRSYYSNTGSYLDITAPGGDTGVDQNGDGYPDGVLQQTFNPRTKNPGDFGYYFFQGTSMASPHVAGVAALLIANGTTGPDNVRAALENTAEDKGAVGWDDVYGHGIVNACAALNYSPQQVHDVAVTGISASEWCLQGETVWVTVSVANQGDFEESITVELTDTTDSVLIDSQEVPLAPAGTSNLTFAWYTTGATIGDHSLEAVASVLTEETNTDNNTMATTVEVKVPVHDVAIIAVDAPSEAVEGDLVQVNVTIENQGTYAETTTVSLTDQTDDIDSQSVTLDAGDSADVLFDWDTTGASIGDHSLEAVASVVTEETDTDDNTMTTVTIINEQSTTPTMHVDAINMALITRRAGRNDFTKALATVTIVDASDNPVEGATINGTWSGATSSISSGTTDASGQVALESYEVKNASSGDTFTFTVSDVVLLGWDFDSSGETSGSITK